MSNATRDALCNRALSLLGEPPATPFAGPGTTLRDITCRAHYEAARDEVFSHHRWDFCTALFPLALADPQPAEAPAQFSHAYDLPPYSLRFQEARLANGNRLEHFAILGNYLFTDNEELEGHILHTTSALDPEDMPPIARECVTYALAARIAEALTQSPNKVEQMRAHLAQAYTRAITTDARQTGSKENMDPLLLARESGSYRSRYRHFAR